MNFLMVFDFTQFWLDGRPGNEYFWISHKISGHLTPMTPLGVHPQWFETTWNRYERFLLLCSPRVSGWMLPRVGEYVDDSLAEEPEESTFIPWGWQLSNKSHYLDSTWSPFIYELLDSSQRPKLPLAWWSEGKPQHLHPLHSEILQWFTLRY